MNQEYKPETREELIDLVNNETIDLATINTSLITDMTGVFANSKRKNYSGINTWDTSKVKSMSRMFANNENFNVELSFADTSSLEDMSYMFAGCKKYDKKINFSTKNVKNMEGLFKGSESYNQPFEVDCSNVLNLSLIFAESNFNQPVNIDAPNCTDISGMFKDNENFNSPVNINCPKANMMVQVFDGAKNINVPVSIKTNEIANMDEMFANVPGIDIDTVIKFPVNFACKPRWKDREVFKTFATIKDEKKIPKKIKLDLRAKYYTIMPTKDILSRFLKYLGHKFLGLDLPEYVNKQKEMDKKLNALNRYNKHRNKLIDKMEQDSEQIIEAEVFTGEATNSKKNYGSKSQTYDAEYTEVRKEQHQLTHSSLALNRSIGMKR